MTSILTLINNWRNSPLYGLLSVQILAVIPVIGLLVLHPDLSLGRALFVQAISAAVLSRFSFKQGRWWMPVHAIFVPALFLCLSLNINPLWYFFLFVLSFLIFGGVWQGRVPLFISSKTALSALDQLLPKVDHLHFLDVGCGNGAVLSKVKSLRPTWTVIGVEAAIVPFLWAKLRSVVEGNSFQVVRADFWSMHWHEVNVVYSYLSPTPMPALWEKIQLESSVNHLLSYQFLVPAVAPDQSIELEDSSRLYRWDLARGGANGD